jgi:pimeloyl-ACP methyl ester carboxylesterase
MILATRPAPTPTRSLDARARRSDRAPSRRRLVRPVAAARSDRAADDGPKLDLPRASRRDVLVRGFASALILPRSRAALADDLFCGYYSQNSAVVPQWARETPWSEGYVDTSAAVGLEGAKTFVRILGDQKKAEGAGLTPVLCLHGGPGLGFKYMDGLEVLASEKREVASYDQIGCARSPYKIAKPKPNGTYTPERFADELAEVRRATGLGRVHVVAHGWGGMLALDHVLGGNGVDGAAGGSSGGGGGGASVASLTLVSVPPSYARLIADRREALGRMPGEYAQVLLDGDEGGAGGGNLSDAGRKLYETALDEWTRRFVSKRAAGACYRGLKVAGAGAGFGARANDPPDALGVASARAVARDMTGGCLFNEAGSLRGWDADDGGRLAMLAAAVPGGVRFVVGEDDALSEAGAREVYDAVARVEMTPTNVSFETFPDSGSCVHLDKSADFLESTAAYVAARDA